MRTAIALSAATLFTIGLTACGAGGGGGAASSTVTDQTTPEGAAQMFLQGMGNKDAKAICDVMAISGKPVSAMGAGDTCATQMKGSIDSMGSQLDSLKNAKVSGATVNGDTADLSTATVSPAQAKGALSVYKTAKKIDGKWYLSFG
ncbi:hypothetical protein B0O41_0611 [Propionibacteriaceae bacterium ES.041]|uniref:DUF4878 domain-containing protein n=1 Tax=Enemella evansiae TaxID=2016499 RepID=A0A255GJV8_9ACTN|nr:hypothetical protein [Enemella evansiae]PFG65838.1 hypothetical protein B0O41_0611 [Propionibacteriaceae bacterium ES.041]OYN98703.1 hypothetical protein CGZ95_12335 [Enemella evansiae]OYO03302.1 hypothetical protein CGZ96_01390 [Enemella evansiae]OYO13884.1 hypothetical protein CGZ98_04670 [Enemella evansiae]OYO16115.1 hypothetical protein CGZ94_05205 [Enemella evansiae]